jgi:hypothetical protein
VQPERRERAAATEVVGHESPTLASKDNGEKELAFRSVSFRIPAPPWLRLKMLRSSLATIWSVWFGPLEMSHRVKTTGYG